MLSASVTQDQLGSTLVAFSRDGIFPEDEAISAAYVQTSALPETLKTLGAAKLDLENEVRQVSKQCPPDVDKWIEDAYSIEMQANKTRVLAREIVRGNEIGEERLEAVQDKENHLDFLTKEVSFNAQLLETLEAVKSANDLMNDMERTANEKDFTKALNIGEDAERVIKALKVDNTTRVKGLLQARYKELRTGIHEMLTNDWRALVHINSNEGTVRICQKLEAVRGEAAKEADNFITDIEERSSKRERTDLDKAIAGLERFEELKSVAERFWQELDDAVVKPRTDLQHNHRLVSIETKNDSLWIGEADADRQIRSLFRDIETIIGFLNTRFPPEFAKAVSENMMPTLSKRIVEDWLSSCIPSSLDAIADYQKVLVQVKEFANALELIGWSGSRKYTEWVDSASKNWLQKRRDDALDSVRSQLSVGIGTTTKATHIETGMVSKNESLNIGLKENGNVVVSNNEGENEWDAWDDDEEPSQSPFDAEENRKASLTSTAPVDDDTSAWDEDWGFGDDDATVGESGAPQSGLPAHSNGGSKSAQQEREVTISQTYTISSIPPHVLKITTDVLEDAAKLSQETHEKLPVAPAAAGLFGLPNLILAMYRAVAPHYYSRDPCGNMYLYNDTIYIADQLKDYVIQWGKRNDLTPRIHKRLKLESEIKSLEMFGKRAYVEEMDSHKTIIKDLLGGAQNFLQSINGDLPPDALEGIENVISHVRKQAGLWKDILQHSAWAQAIGSLVGSVATKIIDDVGDLESLSEDGAEETAKLIMEVNTLEDLFMSKDLRLSMISQYAKNWLKLQALSHILQSNMADIRSMWFDGNLSEQFTASQVVNLIELTFATNALSRLLIKDIRASPYPKDVSMDDEE